MVCRLTERGGRRSVSRHISRASLGDPPQRPCKGFQKGGNTIPPFALSLCPFSGGRERASPRGLSGLIKVSFLKGKKAFSSEN